ncbi:MAG: DUF2291 family protein [Bacteroidetes bacterium]|jgi:predicted lipoprotein|nr:DUF2291 family protein [Bacteroidota bacterium]
MNNAIKYSLWVVICAIVIYFSIDMKPLDDQLSLSDSAKFNPQQYANHYWHNELPNDTMLAVDLAALQNAVQQQNLHKISKKVGISDYVYTFLKANGDVSAINDEYIFCETGNNTVLKIKTKYIFDSNVRNASRQIDIGEFKTIIDYNLVSKEINELIRVSLLSEINKQNLFGKKISVVGAIQIHDTTSILKNIVITPVSIELFP